MVYDIDMLRTFYASYAKRVKAAQQASGKPLTLAEKFYIPTCIIRRYNPASGEAKIMLHSAPTALPCKTPRRKWHCCNS